MISTFHTVLETPEKRLCLISLSGNEIPGSFRKSSTECIYTFDKFLDLIMSYDPVFWSPADSSFQ